MSTAAMFSEEEGETEWKVEKEDEDGCIDNCLWMSQNMGVYFSSSLDYNLPI